MRTTAMCWGFPGTGWYEIIDELCSKIQTYVDEKGISQPVALQVKEKFGTLRFYLNGTDDTISSFVREAENKSSKTCETCGKPGKVRGIWGQSWLYTACDEHTKPEDLKMKEE